MGRQVADVYNQIIEQIPNDGNWTDLIHDMGKIGDSIKYAAPETHGRFWQEIAECLSVHLPDPSIDDTPDFCKKIAAIFSNQPLT